MELVKGYSPKFIVVDLFCGAGGTTTGFVMTGGAALVAACVNHDAKAIKSHWRNNPEVEHFEEDITKLYGFLKRGILFHSPEFLRLIRLVNLYRAFYPNAKVILWASLECTNFSKAKGGKPRDADSRTLADHLHYYVEALQPDYIKIENVVEFMSWGPLDENGKPEKTKNGTDFLRWCKEICDHGYYDEWKELNSADFGAFTSRNRLFGIFARPELPIAWPEPTHFNPKKVKKGKNKKQADLFGQQENELKPWNAVKEVLNFSDEGESIFTRKKPLSEKTLERIYAGLIKYIAKGDTAFIKKYFSGRPAGKVNSVNDPCGTVTTFGGQTLVQPISLLKYNSMNKDGNHTPPSLENPAPVISCQGRLGIIQAEFLMHYYGNGGGHSSIDFPCPTVTGVDGKAIIKPEFFIDKHFGKNAQNQSIDDPAGVIMPNDKHRLVCIEPFVMPTSYSNPAKSINEPAPPILASRRHTYIVNPSHGGHSTSTDRPCPVIVARQDKAPLYLVQADEGDVAIAVYDTDSDVMKNIKIFMDWYSLVDIKMRMLRISELLDIQGFPKGTKLEGNQSDQKKQIGNSVVPLVVMCWSLALSEKLETISKAA